MSLNGQITNLFMDKNMTVASFPRTKTKAITNDNNENLDTLLNSFICAEETSDDITTAPLNADTLGGHPIEDFVQVETFDARTKPKAGFIYPLASSVVPDGFLLCDGSEYSRVQYKELFAAIGAIYGNGDGSTTFNVPNLQTRVPVGAGNGYELGAIGGEAKHTLTVDEMPNHAHTFINQFTNRTIPTTQTGDYNIPILSGGTTNGNYEGMNATGNSQPHNNMQPYTVVNYIIATGKDTGVNVSDIIMGAQALPLEVQYGGTGATTLKDVRQNLGINAKNLLDNSDFRNPVNQRGATNYTVGGYSIDRWFLPLGSDISLTSDGIKIVGMQNQYGSHLWQRIPYYENGKMYTFAVCDSDGEITFVRDVFNGNAVSKSTPWGSIGFDISNGYLTVQIVVNASYTKTFCWAALYEGEYTAETLPEYQSKGYAAELLECQRYFVTLTGPLVPLLNNANTIGSYLYRYTVYFPVKMRTVPTIIVGDTAESSYIKPNAQATTNDCVLLYHNSSSTSDIVQCNSITASADL